MVRRKTEDHFILTTHLDLITYYQLKSFKKPASPLQLLHYPFSSHCDAFENLVPGRRFPHQYSSLLQCGRFVVHLLPTEHLPSNRRFEWTSCWIIYYRRLNMPTLFFVVLLTTQRMIFHFSKILTRLQPLDCLCLGVIMRASVTFYASFRLVHDDTCRQADCHCHRFCLGSYELCCHWWSWAVPFLTIMLIWLLNYYIQDLKI